MRPSNSVVRSWAVGARPGLAAVAGLFLSLAILGISGSDPAQGVPVPPAGPVRAFVTIQPHAYFVERIGGDRVQVDVLVGPGQCAETFEPTAKQLARMAGARLYFVVGMPMEETLVPRLLGNFPGLVVVDTQEGIARRNLDGDWASGLEGAGAQADLDAGARSAGTPPGEHRDDADSAGTTHAEPGEGPPDVDGALDEHDHADGEHTHAHTGADPHTWLDPALAKVIAQNIARGLVQVDPADSARFRANLRSLETDLDRVDAEVRGILAPAKGREMLVYHPYYGYFARAYGLRQAAIEVGGFRPGSKYLAGIIDRARENTIHAIFVQEGVALSAAQTVADEIGGRVIVLDPLSRNYLVNLSEMARRVRAGLMGE
jgi:zinc transport system substrate-binding protein